MVRIAYASVNNTPPPPNHVLYSRVGEIDMDYQHSIVLCQIPYRFLVVERCIDIW